MDPFLELDNGSMLCGSNGTIAAALRGVSFPLAAGEYVAITGESGAGKSTLLTLLGGLQVPTSGRVVMGGIDLSGLSADGLADFRKQTIGFVFPGSHLLPYFTARQN